MRKTISMALAAVAFGFLFAPAAHAALTVTEASLSGIVVTVSGKRAAKNADVLWEGEVVTSSNNGGSFFFTTIVVPLDCIGELSDGVTTLQVSIVGCTLPPPPPAALTATGQTTCWNDAGVAIDCTGTGHDGDFRAGVPLSYTDNGDGTITDNNTGLTWAKQSDDGTIHDWANTYTWADAVAVHIAGLNSMNAGTGFAGYNDWRVPNIREVLSIVNHGQSPSMSEEFNVPCAPGSTVLTGSCGAASGYWTSSTHSATHTTAWVVNFSDGRMFSPSKSETVRVRAVRGGVAVEP